MVRKRNMMPPRVPSSSLHHQQQKSYQRQRYWRNNTINNYPARIKFLFYLCIILFLVILISSHRSLPSNNGSHPGRLPARLREAFHHNPHYMQYDRSRNSFTGMLQNNPSEPRIAIVLPFIGKGPESIPPYLGLFCGAAGGAASLVDFLIFHPGVLEKFSERNRMCPDNVKFINLKSMEHLAANYLLRLMDQIPEDEWVLDNREMMTRILTKHLMAYPYGE
jgi:hypothetical protein